MAVVLDEKDKNIKDPVWLCVKKALDKRLADLEANGPADELALAKERYTGLTYKDVSIEPATKVKSGSVMVCIAVRKTGFARVDIEIEKQDILEIFETFNVPVKNTSTLDEFKAFLNKEIPEPGFLVNRTDADQLVIILPNTDNLKANVLELLGNIFFSKITWDEFPKLNEIYSGDLTIIDPSINDTIIKLTSQKAYNDAANKYTVDSKVVSLADGKMTANIYLLDKDGNKGTPTAWVVNDPTKSTDLLNIKTTQEITENGQCMVVSWEYNTDALTDRIFMAQGMMKVDDEIYSYNINHAAPKVLRLSGAVKQLSEDKAQITLTYEDGVGTLDLNKAYLINGGSEEMKDAVATDITSPSAGVVNFTGPYDYNPEAPAFRYFTGNVILKDELDRQVAFSTFNSPSWFYKLVPPTPKEAVELKEVKNTFDIESKLVNYEVEYRFPSNNSDAVNPTVTIITKVGGEVVDYEIVDKDLTQKQLLKFSVKDKALETDNLSLETIVNFSFPDYLDVPDASITMTTDVKQAAMDVEVSDLKLGVLTVTGSYPKAQADKWSYKDIAGTGFVLEPINVTPDGEHYTLSFQLNPDAPTKSKISGVLVNGSDEIAFSKEIERKKIFFNQYSGMSTSTSMASMDIGVSGEDTSAKNLICASNALLKYTENGVKKTFNSEIKTANARNEDMYRITFTAPQFSEATSVINNLWFDDKSVPNSSTYMDGTFEGLMPMPAGATGIIAEPESLDATDVKFQFDGKIKFFFNDPAKTPVTKPSIYGNVKLNGVPWNSVNITEDDTGYGLKFNRLDETVVETLLMEGVGSAYGYIGYPKISFEQRYGYTGGKQLISEWGNMVKYGVPGMFRVIDEKGNTVYVDKWEVKGFEPGIWDGTGPLKITKGAQGLYGTGSLDMHINGLNKPDSGVTNIVILADGVEYTSRTEFDYIPVDPGEVSVVYDKERDLAVFTVKLPENGITSDKFVVQRDYTYGSAEGGSNTFNWIRDAKAIDERTVTFTCYVMGKASTTYEVWFSNADVKCSSQSTRITLTIEP